MYPNLKAEMVRKGLSLKDLAKQTNIRYETFCKKCRGGAEFTIPEIYKIIEIFGMTFEYLFKRDEELGIPMVRINPALIPETEAKLLAMTFLDGIRRFYSDPKNVEKFQEWQRRKQAEKVLVSA